MKETALLRYTSIHVSTGHKLHFQPKNPARGKMTAINNKNGCGMAEVWYRQFRSISYHWYSHIRSGKIQLWSVVPPTKSAQAISFIFSPKIQLGPNWQQSTTKWMWHGWGVMHTVRQYFISLILSYKVRKNTALLRCTANQVGKGHKLHFQPKNPAWTKLAAINN